VTRIHVVSVYYMYMLLLSHCVTCGEGQQAPQQQCSFECERACAAGVSRMLFVLGQIFQHKIGTTLNTCSKCLIYISCF
jgi:predicted nucleic acid-binding Zn ribbon protein